MHIRVLRLVLSGLMGALLVVSKQAMSGLPNIEPVTLLVILFALELPRETPGAVTVFILLQGVLYGFGQAFFVVSASRPVPCFSARTAPRESRSYSFPQQR